MRHEVAEVKARAEREQERISLLQDVLAEARQAEAAAREEALGTTGLLDQTRTERDDLANQVEVLRGEAQDAAQRQAVLDARVLELEQALLARDGQLEAERERQAALEARVQELVQAEEAARAECEARVGLERSVAEAEDKMDASAAGVCSCRRGCRGSVAAEEDGRAKPRHVIKS